MQVAGFRQVIDEQFKRKVNDPVAENSDDTVEEKEESSKAHLLAGQRACRARKDCKLMKEKTYLVQDERNEENYEEAYPFELYSVFKKSIYEAEDGS